MTLRIDEAEKKAGTLQNRVWAGQQAIKALAWLTQPELIKHAELRIVSVWGSGNEGNKDALRYLNAELERVMADIVYRAQAKAQQDMDHYLGSNADGPRT